MMHTRAFHTRPRESGKGTFGEAKKREEHISIVDYVPLLGLKLALKICTLVVIIC